MLRFNVTPDEGGPFILAAKRGLVLSLFARKGWQKVREKPGLAAWLFPGNSSDEDDACARYPQREVKTLEKLMADAHRTRFAVTFASGSAAYQVLLDEFLSPGDHVIASNKLFVGAFEAFQDAGEPCQTDPFPGENKKNSKDKKANPVIFLKVPAISLCLSKVGAYVQLPGLQMGLSHNVGTFVELVQRGNQQKSQAPTEPHSSETN